MIATWIWEKVTTMGGNAGIVFSLLSFYTYY